MRQNSVFDLVGPDDVLVSTVGPFAKWGEPAVRAAVAAGCTYLDSTGEPPFIRRVFEEFGPPAERSGARLLTAMGYDFAPGALAGALALEEAGPEAVRVDVGYYALGGGPTSLSARHARVARRRDARRRPRVPRRPRAHRAPRRARALLHGRRQARARRSRSAAPSTSRCRRPIPALREVNVYLGWFGPLARPLQAGSFVGAVRARGAGRDAPAMRIAGERALGVARRPRGGDDARAGARGSPPRPTTRRAGSWPRSTSRASTATTFTAGFLAWAAQQRVEGAGALGRSRRSGSSGCSPAPPRRGSTACPSHATACRWSPRAEPPYSGACSATTRSAASSASPGTPDEVFPFFADAGNLEAITPPWLAFEVVTPRPIEMRVGALIEYRLKLHRLPISWLTRIEEWEPGVRFVDAQLAGPYKLWHHTHEFEPDGAGTR